MTFDLINTENSWDIIKSCGLPVVLYGMGNGADMIIDILNGYGVEISDVFASDNFVRGHFFHGKKVLKYSEVKEKYDDFAIVMTFAVHDRETMENVRKMSREHLLLSPTVPVAGGGLFTREYAKENFDKIRFVYSLLGDELSRKTYLDVIKFKISGDISYLFDCYSEKENIYKDIFKLSDSEIFMDLGAYDGDTVREFIDAAKGKYEKIIALEPDKKNFKKLEKNTENCYNILNYNVGIWDCETQLSFERKAGRQSKPGAGNDIIPVTTVDSFREKITFLKMDVEGSESRALSGARETIVKYHPKLYVCAYHRNEDIFSLPLMINSFDKSYEIYFRQHPYIPAWECNFYAK